jgi:hypothetical protein
MSILNLNEWSLMPIQETIKKYTQVGEDFVIKEHSDKIQNTSEDPSIPEGTNRLISRSLLRPVDLYCYLNARFGQPNGMQTFMIHSPHFPDTKPDSANLIH